MSSKEQDVAGGTQERCFQSACTLIRVRPAFLPGAGPCTLLTWAGGTEETNQVKLLVGLVWPWRAHDSPPLSGYVGVTLVPLVPYLAQRHGEARSEVVQRTKSLSSARKDLGLLSGPSCSPELEDACFVTSDTFEETRSC